MPKTIHEHTLATSAPQTSELLFYDVDNNWTRRISKANFIGALLSGGGTFVNPGYTFTVPATGTASLLALEQTYSALKTFSSGINLGHNDLTRYRLGLWTPNIRDNVSPSGGVAATFTTIFASYGRVGDKVTACGSFNNITTTGMTGANTLHIHGLPFTSKSTQIAFGFCRLSNVAFTTPPCFVIGASVNYGLLAQSISGAGFTNIIVSNLTSGTARIDFSIEYLVSGD